MIKYKDNDWFRIISSREFGYEMFELHPIWSEFYDHEELNDIQAWGIDRKWAINELSKHKLDQTHPYYTVKLDKFPTDNMRWFSRCYFITKSNVKLNGFIMNEGELVIGLFYGKDIFQISSHPNLAEETNEELIRFSKISNIKLSELGSLKFETDTGIKSNKEIKGTFELKDLNMPNNRVAGPDQ